jgi:hypothetical protein
MAKIRRQAHAGIVQEIHKDKKKGSELGEVNVKLNPYDRLHAIISIISYLSVDTQDGEHRRRGWSLVNPGSKF